MYHIYSYNTHAEQKYFLGEDMRELYDLISFNGNIVAFSPSGIAGFVATAYKEFYIDPQTHAFQHSTIHLKRKDSKTGKYVFKNSIKSLANSYLKGPFSEVVINDRPLLPKHFYNEDNNIESHLVDEICEGSLNFQKNVLQDSLDQETKEFMEDKEELRPKFLIAPYFYLSPKRAEEWFKLTIKCYERSREIEKELPVYISLIISQEVLHQNELKSEIISKLGEINPDGILLWIDQFEEEGLSLSEVTNFINLLKV